MMLQDPRSLFLEELGKMCDAEQKELQMLQQFKSRAMDEQFKGALADHIDQTRQHIRNLEQCANLLGQPLPRVASHFAEGFVKDNQEIEQAGPTADLVELAHIGGTNAYEHFEIGVYNTLIDQARAMNQPQVVALLEQNLRQEEEMAQRMNQILEQQGAQIIRRHQRAA